MQGNNSEVARLLEQINTEYTAATRGLNGLAAGAATHAAITAREKNLGVRYDQLTEIVGKDTAIELVFEIYNKTNG